MIGRRLDVGEFALAVAAGDRLERLLPESRRAVVVDADDDVAVTREHLRVPAEMPAVGLRRVRAAVDHLEQRPAPQRIEIRRIDDPRVQGLAAPAANGELARIAE